MWGLKTLFRTYFSVHSARERAGRGHGRLVRDLEELLAAKSLNYIEVIPFS